MKITIQGIPKPQRRARNRGWFDKKAGCWRSQTYTDPGQEKENINLSGRLYDQRPPAPLEGALLLGVKAFLPIPKSKSKKWQTAALALDIRPASKPDLDNLLKTIKDCMKGIFYLDDSQVVEYLPATGKYYSDVPRWEIELVTQAEYEANLMERRQTGPLTSFSYEYQAPKETMAPAEPGRLF